MTFFASFKSWVECGYFLFFLCRPSDSPGYAIGSSCSLVSKVVLASELYRKYSASVVHRLGSAGVETAW